MTDSPPLTSEAMRDYNDAQFTNAPSVPAERVATAVGLQLLRGQTRVLNVWSSYVGVPQQP